VGPFVGFGVASGCAWLGEDLLDVGGHVDFVVGVAVSRGEEGELGEVGFELAEEGGGSEGRCLFACVEENVWLVVGWFGSGGECGGVEEEEEGCKHCYAGISRHGGGGLLGSCCWR